MIFEVFFSKNEYLENALALLFGVQRFSFVRIGVQRFSFVRIGVQRFSFVCPKNAQS
ncbi:MAG: hypothetical protein KAI83_05970 [Thiomargarita sp.]|nr:hypothetical protein [Thiomargarita sp.]